LFCRYGARDFRNIGHRAIYVKKKWRTLGCIGWQHAEPVLRSLAYALLDRRHDNSGEQTSRRNWALAARLRPEWQEGKKDVEGTAALLAVLREGSPDVVSDRVVQSLNGGAAVRSVWDSLFAGAGELLIRQPGIFSLHAITFTN